MTSLGDLPDHPASVLSDPHDLQPGGEVDLTHLEHLLNESEHPRVP